MGWWKRPQPRETGSLSLNWQPNRQSQKQLAGGTFQLMNKWNWLETAALHTWPEKLKRSQNLSCRSDWIGDSAQRLACTEGSLGFAVVYQIHSSKFSRSKKIANHFKSSLLLKLDLSNLIACSFDRTRLAPRQTVKNYSKRLYLWDRYQRTTYQFTWIYTVLSRTQSFSITVLKIYWYNL